MVSPLSLAESEQLVAVNGLDPSFSPMLFHASGGNILKARHMLVKIAEQDFACKKELTEEYIKTLTAIVACGGFLDEHLFSQTFDVRSCNLSNLEKLGLIRYTKEGFYPHDTLVDLVEEEGWVLNIPLACSYWNQQIQQTPYNLRACRSMVILSSQIEDCSPFKDSFGKCLETLNARENVNFLRDLVHIFIKSNWEDLLLQASDYLIDYEE